MTDEHAGLDVLEREECLRLLGEEVVGRLGFVDLGQPLILPVNFELDGDVVVFRSAESTKLRSGLGSECASRSTVSIHSVTYWSLTMKERLLVS